MPMTALDINSWQAVNGAALADLDAWVPALNLPRLKRTRSGYSAVAGFRPSRKAGLTDAKRPRAMTIGHRGIRDNAEAKGYSPIDLVAAVFGMEPGEAKGWLADALGGAVAAMERPVGSVNPISLIGTNKAKSGAIERRWTRCLPIADTLAELYLASRGLKYDGHVLRFCPSEQALAALVTDPATGSAQTIQFTYLDGDGRKIRRLFMKDCPSVGVVRLTPDEDVTHGLAVAEGIETALAAPFRPIWACLVANNMAALPVLPGIEALTIFADNDASGTGIRVARECAERWHAADREVTIRMVDAVGVDYADLAKEAA